MRKFGVGILAILFLLLPFHPFLKTFLDQSIFHGNLPTILVAWKEILVVIFCFISLFLSFQKKTEFQFDSLDFAILSFCVVSILTGIFFTGSGFPQNIWQVLWGAKYSLLFLIFFTAVRKFPFTIFEKKKLFNITIFSGTLVIFFGIMQVFLPENFLVNFGYLSEYGNTNPEKGISYCHKIENRFTTDEFCRSQSTFSGPNQFAAYLIVILPILFFGALQSQQLLTTLFFFLIFLAGGINLFLTFSRSVWIGAIFSAAIFFIISARKKINANNFFLIFLMGIFSLFFPIFSPENFDQLSKFSIFFAGGFLFFLVFFWISNFWKKYFSPFFSSFFPLILGGFLVSKIWAGEFFWNIFVRPSSSKGHLERTLDGIKFLKENLIGLGLGDAGPASARFANPGETGFLPESWFLQVGLESGFLGLALFLTIIFLIGQELCKSKNINTKPLFLSLVALVVAGNLLHIFESAAVSLTFFGLMGVALAREEKKFWEKIKKFSSEIFKKIWQIGIFKK